MMMKLISNEGMTRQKVEMRMKVDRFEITDRQFATYNIRTLLTQN